MYCQNCGKQIPEASDHCPYCGHQLRTAEAVKEQQQTSAPETAQQKTVSPAEGKKTFDFKKLIHQYPYGAAAIVAAVVCLIITAVMVAMPKSVDVEKYITLNAGANESAGEVFTKFDSEGFEQAILDANGIKTESLTLSDYLSNSSKVTAYSKQLSVITAASALADSIKVTAAPENDKVTVNVDYTNSLLKQCNVRLSHTKYTKKISDLPGLTSYDPFKDLTVKFEGTSPLMTAALSKTYDSQFNASYELDRTEDIAVGDTVTVTYSYPEASANEQGYTIAARTKDFTVDKGAAYLDDVKDISDDLSKKMQAAALDKVNSHVAKYSGSYGMDYQTYGTPEYIGTYLLTAKDPSSLSAGWYGITYNEALVIYAVKASNSSDLADTTIYLPVMIDNLYEDENGTQAYETTDANLDIAGNSYLLKASGGTSFYSTDGYFDAKELYRDCITKNVDRYQSSETDSLASFGK